MITKPSYLKRVLEDILGSTFLYFLWAAVAVAAFGIFGIRPLLSTLQEKDKLLRELTEINRSLENKVFELETVRGDLSYSSKYLQVFDASLPETDEFQNYILDFVNVATGSGYSVKTVSPVLVGTNEIEVSATMTGNGSLSKLVKDLESLKRFTAVEKISSNKDAATDNVTIKVKIYVYKK